MKIIVGIIRQRKWVLVLITLGTNTLSPGEKRYKHKNQRSYATLCSPKFEFGISVWH